MWNKKDFKGNTKAKKKRTKHKYHKAVLKSICISTGYLFSNNQTKLKVCLSLEKQKKENANHKHRMRMLKCDYIFYINSQYLVFSCPNLFGICLGVCDLHLWLGETKPSIYVFGPSYFSVYSEGPLQKVNKSVKDFPLTEHRLFIDTLLSLSLPQHAAFKTQISINKLTVERWIMSFLQKQKVLHYWGQREKWHQIKAS